MGFLIKLAKQEKPVKAKKEKKVEIPLEKVTIIEEEKKTLETEKTKDTPKPVEETKESVKEVLKEEKKELPPQVTDATEETDFTNWGKIGIVGEHKEITVFKAIARLKGKQNIGRELVKLLSVYNQENKNLLNS